MCSCGGHRKMKWDEQNKGWVVTEAFFIPSPTCIDGRLSSDEVIATNLERAEALALLG